MCELHFHKCACGARWTEARKLSSCDDPADNTAGARCPDSLCMHVGNPRRPVKKECGPCRVVREMLESMEDEEEVEEEEGVQGRGAADGECGRGKGD